VDVPQDGVAAVLVELQAVGGCAGDGIMRELHEHGLDVKLQSSPGTCHVLQAVHRSGEPDLGADAPGCSWVLMPLQWPGR